MYIFELPRGVSILCYLLLLCCGSANLILASAQGSDRNPPSSPCWQYKTDSTIADVVLNDSKIFIGKEGARVEALSGASGERLWSSELGGEIISNIVAADDSLFVVTRSVSDDKNSKLSVRAISSETGITEWVAPIQGSDAAYLGLAGASVLAVVDDGTITSISSKDGSPNWARKISTRPAISPLITSGNVVFPADDKTMKILSSVDGKILSDFALTDNATSVGIDENVLFWGDQRGNVYSYDLNDEKYHWKFKEGGRINSISLSDDGVITSSADNFVYFISKAYGKRKWKRRASNRVAGVVAWGPEYLLVLDITGEQASLISRENGRLLSEIPSPAGQPYTLLPKENDGGALLVSSHSISSYNLNGCRGK
jgi:outer membrane protein assembly factor BamB